MLQGHAVLLVADFPTYDAVISEQPDGGWSVFGDVIYENEEEHGS